VYSYNLSVLFHPKYSLVLDNSDTSYSVDEQEKKMSRKEQVFSTQWGTYLLVIKRVPWTGISVG
jgi:hypothetical protein